MSRVTLTAEALAQARFDRGQRLTSDERDALRHWQRWGSDGYPVHKVGRHWTLDHPAVAGDSRLFDRKRDAIAAWETYIEIYVAQSGLEAQERALAAEGRPA